MRMYDPPHPGEIIKKLCLEPLGLSVTEAAKALGVSRKTLSSILNGHTGISPEMAIRLSIAFDTTPESWLNQQVQYDLRRAEQRIGEFAGQTAIGSLADGRRRTEDGRRRADGRWPLRGLECQFHHSNRPSKTRNRPFF